MPALAPFRFLTLLLSFSINFHQCFFPRLSDLELNTTSTRHRPDPRFSNRPISVLLYFIRSESIVEGIKVFDFKCFNYQSSCLTLLLLSYCSTSSFSKP